MTFAVFDRDRDRTTRIFRKKIIEHRAIWRIFAGRFVRRQRRVSVQVCANAQRRLRFEQPRVRVRCSRFAVRSNDVARRAAATLPERRDVVEDPEPATMRCNHEIIVLNNEIADRSRRQIQSQRFPIRAVIKRDVNAFFSSGEEQTFAFRIFADCVYDLPRWYSVHDFSPRLAAVVRCKNVRPQVIDAQRVDRCVSSVRVEMSGFDQRNLLPCGNARRRHIAPGFSAVAREMHQTVVGSAPDSVRVER